MTYLLFITVSPQGDNSKSRALGDSFVEAYKAAHPGSEVVVRDLNASPINHLDGEAIFAGYVPPESQTPSQKEKEAYRANLIKEIVGAKDIVLASPMWNWNVPSVLKAYIDQIIKIGALDVYTNKHLAEKSVTILLACGGAYGPGSQHPEADFESGYLKHIFSALGSTNIQVLRTELTLAGVVPGMESLVDAKEKSFTENKEAAIARAKSV